MAPADPETDGPRVYDWWSRHPRALRALYAVAFLGRERAFRRRAVETLALDGGERVLELGCGTGNDFGPLREGVGDGGSVVGLDASRGMVAAARDRVERARWANVRVVRGDARRPPLPAAQFDAVYAAMSLSAVADPAAAVAAARRLLRPGGRLVVLDARPFRRWPARLLNPVVVPVARRATDWVPEVDLARAIRRRFESADVTSFHGGSIFVAVGRTCEG